MILALISALVVASVQDIRTREISAFLFPAAFAIRLIYLIAMRGATGDIVPPIQGAKELIFSGLAMVAILLPAHVFGGLGVGDIYCAAAIAVWFGFWAIPLLAVGHALALPHAIFAQKKNKENGLKGIEENAYHYPMIPYLTAPVFGYLAIHMAQGHTIAWLF